MKKTKQKTLLSPTVSQHSFSTQCKL